MEKVTIKLPLKTICVLQEVTDKFLFEDISEEGKTQKKDRDIPFRLRYRLERNKIILDRYREAFEQAKLPYLATYGTLTEDGKNVEVKGSEKQLEYFKHVVRMLNNELDVSIIRIEPEDIDYINNMNLTNDETKILIAYMTNDAEILEDLSKNIDVKDMQEKENENVGTN